MSIKISVLPGNALKVKVDVLALKYAQANYGLVKLVTRILTAGGKYPSLMRPKPTGLNLVDGVPEIGAQQILFVGTVPLFEFGYAEIRDFSRRVLAGLAESAPQTRRIAMTLHGANYGLDQHEAFESEVAGLVDAIRSLDFPEQLSEVIIVESNPGRARRLKSLLRELLPANSISTATNRQTQARPEDSERLRAAGYASESKQHVFVAIPFKDEMDDVYDFGIEAAVRAADFLCVRADHSTYVGGVMDHVRRRIKTARLVVADLTGAIRTSILTRIPTLVSILLTIGWPRTPLFMRVGKHSRR